MQWLLQPGDTVQAGDVIVILEAMKMEHELRAPQTGRVKELLFAPGDAVNEGDLLLITELQSADSRWQEAKKTDDLAIPGSAPPASTAPVSPAPAPAPDYVAPRPDLQRLLDRQTRTLDAARPDAIARRHARNQRTARENIADLCDDGSFIE